MNRSRSLSTKRRKPDSVSSQDSSSSEGGKSTSDNQKKRAKTTSDPPITIRDHFGKAAAADKRNMSSAASDRHVVDSVSDPVSSETCDSPWARYPNPPPRGIFGDNDFWIAQYVSFQYLLVCKMNYSAFRDYLRWYIAA